MHPIESSQIVICNFYDSFTYNIYSDFVQMGLSTHVFDYDDVKSFSLLKKRKGPYILVLGPGPGHPDEYPYTKFFEVAQEQEAPVLGICLGHQMILRYWGMKVIKSKKIKHGRVSILTDKIGLFKKGHQFEVQRYNSLTGQLDPSFKGVQALYDDDSELMAIAGLGKFGLQFHPESIGTSCPKLIYAGILKFFDMMIE